MARFRIVQSLLLVPLVLSMSGCHSMEEVVGELEGLDPAADTDSYSVMHHFPPPGMRWVECPNGRNEGKIRSVGASGGEVSLSAGHRLEVTRGAVGGQTDFLIIEPRSPHITVHAQALDAKEFGGDGVVLHVSWGDRNSCTVPSNAVIARIVPGDSAQALRVIERGPDFIRTRLHSLSTFAIAH